MDTIVHTRPSGRKETYYRAFCGYCGVDREIYTRKSRKNKLCDDCSRKKISESQKGNTKRRGSKQSKESRKKMSEAKKGVSPWNKGLKETREEVKRKISFSKTGSTAWNKGLALPHEQKVKISCTVQGIEEEEFKGFQTPENRKARNKFEELKLSSACFERDNYTCRACNKRGSELNAHHQNSWKFFPDERYELSNLITLCKTCHSTFHKRFGNGKAQPNTKEQMSLFLDKKTVYIITGAPASGKSWVLSNLTGFDVIDTDRVNKAHWRDRIDSSDRPIISITIKVSTFMKNNPDLDYKLVVIQESLETLEQRVKDRGGKVTDTLARRSKRMESLAKQAVFSGTSSEVLEYLNTLST